MTYRFDDVEIDAEGFRVTRAGAPVRLEPKALELLLFLAARPRRLVTKADIQDALWKGTFVTENALTRLVAQIRKALGDDAREPRYIETVPTRGYRFVAPLEPGEDRPSVQSPGAGTGKSPPAGAREKRRGRAGRRVAVAAGATLAVAVVVLALSVWSGRRRGAEALRAGGRGLERQVSTSAGLNVFPCFSPDGASLAFATQRGASMEIVVRGLARGAREVAITADGGQNVEPAFSPDGRLLAYHSVVKGGIWVVPALGGLPRQVVTWGSSPAWSPDGSTLAFQGQPWVGSSQDGWSAGEGSTLWTAPAEGGKPRRLTAIEETGPGGHGRPRWSPDGRRIVFVAGTRLLSVRPDGTDLRQTSGDVWVNDAIWGRDGRTQIWTGVRQANWFVWRVPVDPATGERTGEPEVLAGGGDTASAWRQPALSPDGRALAYATLRTRSEILGLRVGGKGEPRGTPVPLVKGIAGRKFLPMFSPDGRRLAFGTVRPGEGLALWMIDLASGEPRLLAEQPGLVPLEAWLPDSRRLGFLVRASDGATLWTVDVESGERVRRRAVDPSLRWLTLSPDGTTLAAHGPRNGVLNVFTGGFAGGGFRALTDDRAGAGWPTWSPDGASLAVELMRHGTTQVGVMPAGSGPVRELTSAPGQSWPHSFSPDGRSVVFAGQREGLWNVYRVGVDGGPEERITAYASPAVYVRYPDWSPRGDLVAYEYAETTSAVWTTELVAP
jgi:Tol biopolymer transport system component/DNA-binding winged helix-turn-helix (wHTH) protein